MEKLSQNPWARENYATLMLEIAQPGTNCHPVSRSVPDCPPELEATIPKMLEREVSRRFQTIEEVLSETEPF